MTQRADNMIQVYRSNDRDFRVYEVKSSIRPTKNGLNSATAMYTEGGINISVGDHSFVVPAPEQTNPEYPTGLAWQDIINSMQQCIINNNIGIDFPFSVRTE